MGEKQKQGEFEGMPERSELGRKAIEYINQLDQIEGLKNTAENTRADLVNLFKKEGKEKITVEGRSVSHSHNEVDKISIKQDLNKNKDA